MREGEKKKSDRAGGRLEGGRREREKGGKKTGKGEKEEAGS